MRTITFSVKQQRIRNTNSISHVYKGTDNYLELKFDFDLNWNRCAKAIVFMVKDKEVPYILENDRCVVPEEAFDTACLRFYLVGKKKDYRIESQKFDIKIGG